MGGPSPPRIHLRSKGKEVRMFKEYHGGGKKKIMSEGPSDFTEGSFYVNGVVRTSLSHNHRLSSLEK